MHVDIKSGGYLYVTKIKVMLGLGCMDQWKTQHLRKTTTTMPNSKDTSPLQSHGEMECLII